MSFTKLDRGITQSSVMAEDPATFKVWIIFLAHTDPDGIARITAPFVSAVGRLTLDTVHEAIRILEAPDPESRSTSSEGRRIQRVDGGWLVINYARYRARSPQEYEAERKRRWRQANPSIAAAENSRRRHPAPPCSSDPDEDSERDGEIEEEGEGEPSGTCPGRTKDVPDGQAPFPPSQAKNGLLPIPKGISFKVQDELREFRAEIRLLGRKIREGTNEDDEDPQRLDAWKRQFNQRIKDLR